MEELAIEDTPKKSSWPIYLYIPNIIGKQFLASENSSHPSELVFFFPTNLKVHLFRFEVNLVDLEFSYRICKDCCQWCSFRSSFRKQRTLCHSLFCKVQLNINASLDQILLGKTFLSHSCETLLRIA